jgi:hypothetical protein
LFLEHCRLTQNLLLGSAMFAANAAWLVIATLAHNLLRWVAALGLGARGELVVAKTLRRTLLTVPGRITRSARRLILHLPPAGPGSMVRPGPGAAALRRLRHLTLRCGPPAPTPIGPAPARLAGAAASSSSATDHR